MNKQVIQISLEQAQRITLFKQQLMVLPPGKGKMAALATIEQLGYLQIDTLNVITRAHHHTL